jgi:hypothetical protein
MARKKAFWRQGVDARYWRNVDIQDHFWRETFVSFVKPLGSLYKDPRWAGALVLSRFLSDPSEAGRAFTAEPEAFGVLISGAIRSHSKAIYAELSAGREGPPLQLLAKNFDEARAASAELTLIAVEHPSLYQELQRQRAARNATKENTRVQIPEPNACQ